MVGGGSLWEKKMQAVFYLFSGQMQIISGSWSTFSETNVFAVSIPFLSTNLHVISLNFLGVAVKTLRAINLKNKTKHKTTFSPLSLAAVEEKTKTVIKKVPASLLSNNRGVSLFDLV